jgi:DNA invertase Pin-like site-specific DNA recombinase
MAKTKGATCCIYARVSTANHHQNPEVQLRELRQFAKQRKWRIVAEYVDEGISGAKDSRPQLDKLMADAKAHKFDAVLVWRFDRFARSVTHLLRALEAFNSLGIAFVSLSEQIDTSTPAGKMVFTVLGAVAELERSLIGERIKAGLRNAKANGVVLGKRPLRPLTPQDIAAIRRDRRQKRLTYAKLAEKHRITVWTAFYTCNPPKRVSA